MNPPNKTSCCRNCAAIVNKTKELVCGAPKCICHHSLPQENGSAGSWKSSGQAGGSGEFKKPHIETSSWEKPEDFKKFRDFAIDCGVPGAAFWDDAVHCSCFFDGKDGDEDSPGVVRGMYQMWKAQEETLSQARREYMTSLSDKVWEMKESSPYVSDDQVSIAAYQRALNQVIGLIEKDLEK